MELLHSVFHSLRDYFNAVTQFGYKKQGDINKLLIYIFISEMLTGDMREFVTEEDYRIIERALYCLYGSSCLLPYPKYINDDSLFGHSSLNKIMTPRLMEDNLFKLAESDNFRITGTNYNY